jgi:hypothetical protein
MLFSANALAKPPAETTLDVKATLTTAMTVSCSQALDFGELFIPTGNQGGDYDITMSPGDGSVSSPGAVSIGGGAQRGKCTVSDSVDSGNLTIDLKNGATSLATDGDSNPAFQMGAASSNAPGTPKVLDVHFHLSNATISATSGDDDFFIGGKLVITKSMGTENYGDYAGTIDVKISDDT